jgi:hypothetical protein
MAMRIEGTVVPEPVSCAFVLVGAALLRRHRRR